MPLRLLILGAHPDDADYAAGGLAALYRAAGHDVRMISLTNGDAGHHETPGPALARRRTAEAAAAGAIIGARYELFENHDGELQPTLENRWQIIHLIRSYDPDLILTHRPNDYHPDHRYTGVLVQDSAYMVMVPFICPDTPPMKKNPAFLFYSDRFQKPTPFEADVTVSIDDVLNQKLDALDVIVSQFYEGGALGSAELLPATDEGQAARRREVRAAHAKRFDAEPFRAALTKWYGADGAKRVGHVEAFEVCEYGRQPSDDELKNLFLIDAE